MCSSKRAAVIAVVGLWVPLSAHAQAVVENVHSIRSAVFSSSNVYAFSLSPAIAEGHVVSACITISDATRDLSSITDSAGSTYTVRHDWAVSGVNACATAVAAGSVSSVTFTINTSTGSDHVILSVLDISGATYADSVATGTTTTTTHATDPVTISTATGVLHSTFRSAATGEYTIDANYSVLQNYNGVSARLSHQYRVVSGSGNYTMTNTTGGNRSADMILLGFDAAGSAAPPRGLMLRGVGR